MAETEFGPNMSFFSIRKLPTLYHMESVLTIFHLLPPGFIEFWITFIIYRVDNFTYFLSIIYSCEKSKFTL